MSLTTNTIDEDGTPSSPHLPRSTTYGTLSSYSEEDSSRRTNDQPSWSPSGLGDSPLLLYDFPDVSSVYLKQLIDTINKSYPHTFTIEAVSSLGNVSDLTKDYNGNREPLLISYYSAAARNRDQFDNFRIEIVKLLSEVPRLQALVFLGHDAESLSEKGPRFEFLALQYARDEHGNHILESEGAILEWFMEHGFVTRLGTSTETERKETSLEIESGPQSTPDEERTQKKCCKCCKSSMCCRYRCELL